MDIAISPKLLTDFRLGYYRYNVIDTKHDQGTEFANTLGIPGINIGGTITSGAPGFVINNLPGGGGGTNGTVYGDGLGVNRCNCPLTEREDQFQIVNNWTKIIGNHAVKVGADLRYGRNLRVPSDNDRAGQLNFATGPTENPLLLLQGGLGFALPAGRRNQLQPLRLHLHQRQGVPEAHLLLCAGHLARHPSSPEPGLRWDLYFPESTNGPGNGSLLNLPTAICTWPASAAFLPTSAGPSTRPSSSRTALASPTSSIQKTVVRAGYGRSFDTGVFGSIFGHTITQNIPVLANQQLNSPTNVGEAFTLAVGPTPTSRCRFLPTACCRTLERRSVPVHVRTRCT
jgi:hypothetical protein